MNKNKYNLIKDSIVSDGNGNFYPDLATFPINDLIPTTRYIPIDIYEQNIYTFYNFIYDIFSTFSLYDDILLWLNDIPYLDATYENTILKVYTKKDIDAWYVDKIS